jgi:hypothetical protein
MSIISRNGKSYGNADVQIAMFGSIDYEVTKITYGVKQAHTANYSLGSNDPSSYSMGKKEYSCTLGLRLKSFSELEKAAGGDLMKIKPFNIAVTFVDDENEIIVDVIKAKFTSQGRDVGDSDDITRDFEMFCLGIDFNIS